MISVVLVETGPQMAVGSSIDCKGHPATEPELQLRLVMGY